MRRLPLLVTVATLAVGGGPAYAEELFPGTAELGHARGIGIGVLHEDEGYRDGSAETEPLPVLFYQTNRFRLLGPQAEFRVWDAGPYSASLRAEYRFDGFDPADEDNRLFDGMAERKASAHAGVEFKRSADWGTITVEYLRSLSASKGSRSSVYFARPFSVGEFQVMPKLGVERYDEKFTDYYYGVRPGEARADRASYRAGSSTNLDLGVDLQRSFGQHLVLGSVKYRHFGQDIADSPLIDANGSLRVTLAYIYRF